MGTRSRTEPPAGYTGVPNRVLTPVEQPPVQRGRGHADPDGDVVQNPDELEAPRHRGVPSAVPWKGRVATGVKELDVS